MLLIKKLIAFVPVTLGFWFIYFFARNDAVDALLSTLADLSKKGFGRD